MKKSTKILLLGGILLVLVGGITMLISGSILGSQKVKEYVESGDFAITLNNLEELGFYFNADEFPDNAEKFVLEKEQVGKFSDVKNLDIVFGAGTFHILESEDEYIYLEMKHVGVFEYGIDQESTLYVKPKNNTIGSATGEIKLYLPQNMIFDEVKLELGAGELYANYLEMKKLEVSVAAGAVNLNQIVSDDMELEVGAGELVVDQGDVKKLSVDLSMGEVLVKLTGKEDDYDFDLSCGAGEVKVGSMVSGGVAFERDTDFGREKKIDIECALGTVEISFAE